MTPHHRLEIDAGQNVAVEDQQSVVHAGRRVLDGAPGAQRIRLDHVAQRQAGLAPVTHGGGDPVRSVIEAQDDFVDLGHLPQQVDLIIEKGPVENRHDRLGQLQRERTQPRTEATGENDGLHDGGIVAFACASRVYPDRG